MIIKNIIFQWNKDKWEIFTGNKLEGVAIVVVFTIPNC